MRTETLRVIGTDSPESLPSPPVSLLPAAPPPMPAIEQMLTRDDIADILQCNPRTIDRLRSSGKLPKPDFRSGRLLRWRHETIERWISRGGR